MKARNASGLSPLSNTLTASVPEAAEEEQLITARHEDGGNTLVSNLGQTVHSGGANAGPLIGRHFDHAIAFTTGANPFGYHVTSVQIYLSRASFAGTPSPDVSIRADDGAVPGETVLYTLTTTSAVTVPWNSLTFTTTDNFTLQPNTTYWLYATTMGTNQMFIGGTESDDEDTESNTDWRIGDARYSRADGGTWTQKDDFNLGIKISGHPAPEFLVSNLEAANIPLAFTRNTNLSGSKLAQSFSAANNVGGSSAEFDFDGITALLQSSDTTPAQLASSDIFVTVHSDTNGQPGDLVYTMIAPETYTLLPDGSHITFSAPPGSTLSSGVTYWVKFEIAPDSTFFAGEAEIFFGYTTDDTEVQGPYADNDWSIQDDSLWSPETLSWRTDPTRSVKISVLGSQSYDTLVSNIDQTFLGTEPTGAGVKAAQSFRTPPGRLGQQYRLSSLRIIASSENPTHAMIDLHADDNGTPGNHLASMIMPGDFAQDNFVVAELTATAPRNTNLNTGTRYWFVFSNEQEDNLLRISVTESKAQDSTALDGWTIGDRRTRKIQNQPWAEVAFPIRMELLGTPFIRTNESDGPDLPGAGHNAHQTGAVVTPGIVSTGHLTPGLDRNHGLYGDYWWLDTQWGHSYRIEVKFGDSPNTATGGSAWTYFIDGDRRGTCCDSDHNRNDGYTVLHIKHDQNRKYLIDVVVFDKLNSGSKNFNGPYTITMTDITGTDKLVSNLYIGTLTKVANYVGSNRQYASSFTAGHNPGGYKLDRIRTHIPDDHSSPVLALHTDTSFAPGTKLCDFRNPTQVQHLVYWEDFPAPIPFTAPDCTDVTLAANGKYWIVFAGTGYKPVVTDSGGELTKEGGWSIGNTALTKTTSTWGDLAGSIIAAEIWASRR